MTARSDRPTSREISWVRPPIRPLTDSRSERVWVERREHRVLRRHPAEAGVLAPPRHAGRRGRRAQHPRPAELDQHRAGRMVQPVPGHRDRTELVVGPPSARVMARDPSRPDRSPCTVGHRRCLPLRARRSALRPCMRSRPLTRRWRPSGTPVRRTIPRIRTESSPLRKPAVTDRFGSHHLRKSSRPPSPSQTATVESPRTDRMCRPSYGGS